MSSITSISQQAAQTNHNYLDKLLQPIREYLDRVEINNQKIAHLLCQLIPAQCPFERDVKLFGHLLFHIPAMCKLNPLYDQFIGLRFRALTFLADVCGEDITGYIKSV
ncbi:MULTISPECIES: Mo-dependent nitrogenase C-terminal domain-containing protein [Okeania]|uniref:Mo-dependent nitrogenase C-terminal domain-containing protein n=1 Tax=Okeania TaxID=1458928 RepID=UPI000F54A664|nr:MULTISPECIES: Mo-dependent nitrogenase C-terminal domain-containing protein [Okeania]NEP04359.1 nitrogenase [Okeania sp. SIO4D6]NEP41459.1 nitrogenase [Okeania sp. SIO2H7]NET15532.1 nitrogenase [Okeania sp. SIO1H6]NEP73258.1 nitrogenase [Okeania sp. SIO2G5]NEP94123.1 nitrogenase [Okeania sp. SIO2F5]